MKDRRGWTVNQWINRILIIGFIVGAGILYFALSNANAADI